METNLRHRKASIVSEDEFSSDNVSISSKGDIHPMDIKKDMSYSYGKTPDGRVFRVPVTREMVANLLNPKVKKGAFDWITLGIMAVEISLFFLLPVYAKRLLFIFIFFFWRLAYNAGLGLLLKYQSDNRGLVRLAKKYKIFDREANPRSYHWLRYQLSIKMSDDYDFDTAPIEYNTWMLYRQLVDLILMNDFTTYICFALSWCNTSPESSIFLGNTLRWCGGIFLVLFNIWVKIDAQRVVKDFAWYWGDFFFLIEQSLTFDGVFEMAPHPMYSIGYCGYYGISLMAASYTVLLVSIAAHALQFAFLILVETPHIDKTYNPPTIIKRQPIAPVSSITGVTLDKTYDQQTDSGFHTSYFHRDMIGFKNFHFFRSSDLITAIVMIYAIITPILVPKKTGLVIAVVQAFFWRLAHSLGNGLILRGQSNNKLFTRHFIKWGGDVQEAFKNWKRIYNVTLCMSYITFLIVCWKTYTLPENWSYGTTSLRHVLGLAFISLHIWTSVSIYEVIGDFGWFYGDFFLDEHPSELLYTGIYRFLNNPEKIMGHAAFWGMTLIANNGTVFTLVIFSQICNVLFVQYVENPHMRKLYGDQIRKEAGLTKTLKSAAVALPKTIPKKIQQEIAKIIRNNEKSTKNVERIVKDTVEKVEKAVEETVVEIVEAARPRLQEVLSETRQLLKSSRTRVIPLTSSDIKLYDLSQYSVKMASNSFVMGQNIQVEWKAPECHGARDWIGIFEVKANKSKSITNISSRGLWYWVNAAKGPETDDILVFPPETLIKTEGAVTFSGSKLPWKVGTYEFRYQHDNKHNVMAVSAPFEIKAPDTPSIIDIESTQETVLKFVQNALGNNEELMPTSADEEYIGMGEVESRHLVHCIRLVYNVEFAWEVVSADKCVTRLANRILQAREALSPFTDETSRRLSSTSLHLASSAGSHTNPLLSQVSHSTI